VLLVGWLDEEEVEQREESEYEQHSDVELRKGDEGGENERAATAMVG